MSDLQNGNNDKETGQRADEERRNQGNYPGNYSGNYSGRGARRRKLNISAIKSGIIFLSSTLIGLLSGFTGISGSGMLSPTLSWMLGYKEDRAQANAILFTSWMAASAIVGLLANNIHLGGLWWRGLVLTLGSIVGAALLGKLGRRFKTVRGRQSMQGLGTAFALVVISVTTRTGGAFAGPPNFVDWSNLFPLLGVGIVTGAIAATTGWIAGMFLVPVLYYTTARAEITANNAAEAIFLSMMMITIASVLPAWAYTRTDKIDRNYSFPLIMGGILGGFAGGILAPRLSEKVILIGGALISMFLCARELYQLSNRDPGTTAGTSNSEREN